MADVVFNQDIILEIILNHAIHNDDKENSLSRATICALRLVRKNWLQIISKLLQKSKEPLYKILLNGKNSVIGSRYVYENGKMLAQYRMAVTDPYRIGKDSNPFLDVTTEVNFFRQENHKDFIDFLLNSGSQLVVELEMYVPMNCGSFPCLFPKSLLFPNLKKLTVHLTNQVLRLSVDGERQFLDSLNTTHLIQTFFEGSENLIEFTVLDKNFSFLSFGFELLSLPSTIKRLHLQSCLKDPHLKQLAESKLSNLTNLKLVLLPGRGGDEHVHKMFPRFGAQLKSLEMNGSVYNRPILHPRRISFPVMENLQMLSISSLCFDLQCLLNPLSNLAPNVSSVVFHHITAAMLTKLAQYSTFQNVKTLCIRLVDDRFLQDNQRKYVVDINHIIMHRIHLAFPNVRNFTISVSSKSRRGLEYVFREMGGLRSLEIMVTDGDDRQACCPEYWDAVLMGTTTGKASMLRTIPYPWMKYGEENFDSPSLKMLNELENLSLEANCSPVTPQNCVVSVILDMTFHYALLQMPKLRKLHLRGRFVASAQVTRLWNNEGRTLVYTPPM